MSVRAFVEKFQQNALVLFKLCWLEKKITFYGAPASIAVDSVYALLSLFPSLLPSLVTGIKSMFSIKHLSLPIR